MSFVSSIRNRFFGNQDILPVVTDAIAPPRSFRLFCLTDFIPKAACIAAATTTAVVVCAVTGHFVFKGIAGDDHVRLIGEMGGGFNATEHEFKVIANEAGIGMVFVTLTSFIVGATGWLCFEMVKTCKENMSSWKGQEQSGINHKDT